MEKLISLAVVSMKTALKYRRDWNKNGPGVKLLRKMMPKGSKDYRLYIPVGESVHTKALVVPHAVRHALKVAGYRVTDYLTKKCVKVSDKEQKNFYNIGKVIAKDPVAKAAFDNDPQLQNSNADKIMLVVSCHPYDIIGMSTGRDWDQTSCMRLADDRKGTRNGSNYQYVEKDVAEGTLVVYAIKGEDTNINQPLCRCLLKPFVNDAGNVLYRRETSIYGNPVPGFDQTLGRFLRRLNKDVPDGFYKMVKGLYDDSIPTTHNHKTSESISTKDATDWESGVSETLEQQPELAANYVAWRIAKEKRDQVTNGTQGADARDMWHEAIHDVLTDLAYGNHANNNLKQVGRVIGSHPEAAQGFYDSFAHGSLRPMLGELFRSPTLRKAMQAVEKKPISEFRNANSLRNHTFIGPEYSAAFLEKFDMYDRDLDMDDLITSLVENYFKGWLKLTKADLEKYPPLKGLIWLWANIQRTSELYDKDPIKNAQYVYRVLATVSKPENLALKYKRGLLVHLNEDGDSIAVGTWGMMALKDDPEFFKEIQRMWPDALGYCIRNRRFRREMFKLAKTNPDIANDLGKAIATCLTDMNQPGAELKNDFLSYAKSSGNGINTGSLYKLRKTLNSMPEFAPYAYCPMRTTFTAKYLMEDGELDWFAKFWTKYAQEGGEHVTAVNPNQQALFDCLGAFMSIQHPPIAAPFDFDGTKALNSLKQSEHLIAFGGDFQRFPNKLTEDAVKGITFDSFIRSDNGAKSLKIFGKKAPNPTAAVKWVQKITDQAFRWPEVMVSIGMKVRAGRLEFENYVNTHTVDQVRELFAKVADRFTKGLDFLDSLPDYNVEPPTGEKEFFARMGIKEYSSGASNELGRTYAHMADFTSSIEPTFQNIRNGIALANQELADELLESVQPIIDRALAAWLKSTKDGEPIFVPKKESREDIRKEPPVRRPYQDAQSGRPGAYDPADEDEDVS